MMSFRTGSSTGRRHPVSAHQPFLDAVAGLDHVVDLRALSPKASASNRNRSERSNQCHLGVVHVRNVARIGSWRSGSKVGSVSASGVRVGRSTESLGGRPTHRPARLDVCRPCALSVRRQDELGLLSGDGESPGAPGVELQMAAGGGGEQNGGDDDHADEEVVRSPRPVVDDSVTDRERGADDRSDHDSDGNCDDS